MKERNARLEEVLSTLRDCSGVIVLKILSEKEKGEVLDIESKVEEKIVFGMCKSLNKGVRESLQRMFTVAMVIQTSEFQYPHHPHMVITSGGQVVGELVDDEKKIEELRKDPGNLFLWKNFVVYMRKLPRNPKERNEMKLVYLPRAPLQLQRLSYVKASVFGTPSTEGDILIKRMLDTRSEDSVIGTSLIGFNIEE